MPGGRHHTEVTDRILACLDMLVDGPFVQDLYDISLRFRGSSNQRVIDMNATRARAEREGVALCDAVELWRDDPSIRPYYVACGRCRRAWYHSANVKSEK